MYEFNITVEFEDIDSYGIVHHPKFLYYFERARVHFFEDMGINLNKLNFGVVLRNMEINFKTPLFLHDNVTVLLGSKNIDKFRFDFDYIVKKNNKITTTATIEFVTINLATKKIIPIPEIMREFLGKIKIE